MGLNQPERDKIVKEAEKRGYVQGSDGKMKNDKGDWLKFSPTGGSVKSSSAGTYTSAHDLKESENW